MVFLAQRSKVLPQFSSKFDRVCHSNTLLLVTISFLIRVSIAVMKHHDQNASLRAKGLFGLNFSVEVHQWRKSGQKHKQSRIRDAGADAEAIERCCLLPCFPWLYQLTFLREPRTSSPLMTPLIMDWAFPHWSLNEKMPYNWISWRHFLSWGSFL